MIILVSLFIFALFPHAPAVIALEAPLEFVGKEEIQDIYIPYGQIDSWFSEKPPGEIGKLPTLKSAKPRYAFLKLGDRPHLMVLDAEKRGRESRTTLYVDCNGNGDLTDDRPLAVPSRGWSGSFFGRNNRTLLPPLDMTITVDGATGPYRLRLELVGKHSGRSGSGPAFRWLPYCQYRAVITGNNKYTILLNDFNRNARFGFMTVFLSRNDQADSLRPASPGDSFSLIEKNGMDRLDYLQSGSLLVLENKTCRVKIDIPARKLILDEIDKGLAPLNLAMLPHRLTLSSLKDNRDVIVYRPSDTTIMIPPGDYRLVSYQAFRADAKGDIWRISAREGKNSQVTVASGTKSLLLFGEPYLPKANVYVAGRGLFGGRNVSMDFHLEGRGKEQISNVTFFKNTGHQSSPVFSGSGGRPVAPSYTVVKADGELVAKGDFRYG